MPTRICKLAGETSVEALRLSYDRQGVQREHTTTQMALRDLISKASAAEGPRAGFAWYLQWRDLPAPLGPDEVTATAPPSPHGAHALMSSVRRPAFIKAAALRQLQRLGADLIEISPYTAATQAMQRMHAELFKRRQLPYVPTRVGVAWS